MHTAHARALKTAFDENASHYDEERRMLIPCFDDFYGTALRGTLLRARGAARILDLGAGTGLFSRLLAGHLPEAHFTLVDMSATMLAKARELFALTQVPPDAVSTRVLNYADPINWDAAKLGPFDAVISALSIHHLDDADKAALFARVRGALAPGGVFVNADQTLGDSDYFEKIAEAWLTEDQEQSQLSKESLAASRERRNLDRTATFAFQLDAMRAAGFTHSDMFYRNGLFAVFVGLV